MFTPRGRSKCPKLTLLVRRAPSNLKAHIELHRFIKMDHRLLNVLRHGVWGDAIANPCIACFFGRQ
jgi:hypothetical protein